MVTHQTFLIPQLIPSAQKKNPQNMIDYYVKCISSLQYPIPYSESKNLKIEQINNRLL